jgi:hypothetical protein
MGGPDAQIRMDVALDYLLRFTGDFYKWGAAGPDTFDCSGLACEYLKSMGLVGRGEDFTAAGLAAHLPLHGSDGVVSRGDLVFFGSPIIHVEIVLVPPRGVVDGLSFGASGGGADTTTVARALERGAWIKMRPIKRGVSIAGFADVTKALETLLAKPTA